MWVLTASISDNSGHSTADQAFDLAYPVGKSSVCFLRGREDIQRTSTPVLLPNLMASFGGPWGLDPQSGLSSRLAMYFSRYKGNYSTGVTIASIRLSHVILRYTTRSSVPPRVTIHDLAWVPGPMPLI